MSEQNSNQVSTTANKVEKPKLKILAFHGYRQNGATFRGKIGSFRKTVSKYAQLVFITAPHKVVTEDGAGDEAPLSVADNSISVQKIPKDIVKSYHHWWDSECADMIKKRKEAEKLCNRNMTDENFSSYLKIAAETKRFLAKKKQKHTRSWWFNAEDNTFSGKCLGGPAIGFEDTLNLIKEVVDEHGPFDGFMGFSQGACLVGILAAMQQKGYLQYTFKFAIFASGFRSGSLVHKGFYDEDINLPSLHVYGESDSIIPKEMSESLINLFTNPVVAEHTGGHYVACSGSIKDAYLDFLHERFQEIIEAQHIDGNKVE